MKKNSPAYLEMKESIFQVYIQPFLAAIDDNGLNRATIIDETMRRFQIEVTYYYDKLSASTPGTYLSDINSANMPEEFKTTLQSNPDLCKAYIELGHFYIGGYQLDLMSKGVVPKTGKLYVCRENGALVYTVINKIGKLITGRIEKSEIEVILQSEISDSVETTKSEVIFQLDHKRLKRVLRKILNVIANQGHNHIGEDSPNSMEISRTIVREIFFDLLTPFSEMRLLERKTTTIKLPQKMTRDAEGLWSLPGELHLHINSFFQNDPTTIIAYRTACKHAYSLQKHLQDKPGNVYYTVGNEVKVVNSHQKSSSYTPLLDNKISDNELIQATKLAKNKPLKLFTSLYDAIEYAQFLRNETAGLVPVVMTVSYIGDSTYLEVESEIIPLNEGKSSSAYSRNRRDTFISYIPVLAEAVLPLAAIAICQNSDFSSYHVFNKQLNLLKGLEAEEAPETAKEVSEIAEEVSDARSCFSCIFQ